MQPHPPVVPLVIETKFPPLRWSLALRSPRITIDGHRVAASWGRTVVPVLPGPHQVQISSNGLFGSPSQIMVDTRWPQTVYYAASWSVFTGGAVGAQPVSSPGVWVRVA